MKGLEDIRENLHTQDNRITHLPLFAVEQKRRIYGMEPEYADDNFDWVYEDGEYDTVEDEKADALEDEFQATGETPKGYARWCYTDVWEFVTACFTEQGCKDFIACNGHNLKETRIYVYSGYRNAEWERIRKALSGEEMNF